MHGPTVDADTPGRLRLDHLSEIEKMPHLVLEASAGLASLLDFDALLQSIHQGFDRRGYASASAIRSRVYVPVCALSGIDRNTQFVVATLTTTVARPPDMHAAMAQLVHDEICQRIEASGFEGRWQCGVFRSFVTPDLYIRTDSHSGARP